MFIQKFKPVNNSKRLKIKISSFSLSTKKFKRLKIGFLSKAGRNNSGRIVTRHKSKGLKKSIFKVDFFRKWTWKPSICINTTKSPKINCFLALLKYSNGTFSYILSPFGLKPGNIIFSTLTPPSEKFLYKLGYRVIIRYLNYNHLIFNLEINSLKGGQYSKSAGTFCKILELNFENNISKIQLPSGKIKSVFMLCFATVGKSSNINFNNQFICKAGYYRNLGVRPTVRGVAMNPIDHPHGGRTKTNSPEKTPWGKIAKKNK